MASTRSAQAPKVTHKKKPSKSTKKKSTTGLSTCPINGAGWCAYPFSAKQLERRMKTKQLAIASSGST
jgi:hypothetical protein